MAFSGRRVTWTKTRAAATTLSTRSSCVRRQDMVPASPADDGAVERRIAPFRTARSGHGGPDYSGAFQLLSSCGYLWLGWSRTSAERSIASNRPISSIIFPHHILMSIVAPSRSRRCAPVPARAAAVRSDHRAHLPLGIDTHDERSRRSPRLVGPRLTGSRNGAASDWDHSIARGHRGRRSIWPWRMASGARTSSVSPRSRTLEG